MNVEPEPRFQFRIVDEKHNLVELQMNKEDHTLARILVHIFQKNQNIKHVSYRLKHPFIKGPCLVLVSFTKVSSRNEYIKILKDCCEQGLVTIEMLHKKCKMTWLEAQKNLK